MILWNTKVFFCEYLLFCLLCAVIATAEAWQAPNGVTPSSRRVVRRSRISGARQGWKLEQYRPTEARERGAAGAHLHQHQLQPRHRPARGRGKRPCADRRWLGHNRYRRRCRTDPGFRHLRLPSGRAPPDAGLAREAAVFGAPRAAFLEREDRSSRSSSPVISGARLSPKGVEPLGEQPRPCSLSGRPSGRGGVCQNRAGHPYREYPGAGGVWGCASGAELKRRVGPDRWDAQWKTMLDGFAGWGSTRIAGREF